MDIGAIAPLFDPSEAERIVQELAPVGILELGTTKWLQQHKIWERLNAASHRAAATNSDDLALSTLLTYERLHLAVRLAIAVESWRTHVLPKIAADVAADAASGGPLRCYYVLHSEAVAVNLLETVLYHAHAAEALASDAAGDALLDIIDYAVRNLNRLIMTTHARNSTASGGGAGAAGPRDAASRAKLAANANPAAAAFSALAGDAEDGNGSGSASGAADAAAASAASEAGASDVAAMSLRAVAAREKADRDGKQPLITSARELAGQCRDIQFNIGCACVSILRFLAEHLPKLPLAAVARLLDHHDLPLAMIPLLENPPWVRRVRRPAPAASTGAAATAGGTGSSSSSGSSGAGAGAAAKTASSSSASSAGATTVVWQKFMDRQWRDVAPADLLKLTPMEAQPWLALLALLTEPTARKRYEMHSHRKGTLLRARRFLNEPLLDQLPPLRDIQRYLDELSLLAAPDVSAAQTVRTALLLQQVASAVDELETEAKTAAAAALAAKAAGTAGAGSAASGSATAKLRAAAAPSLPFSSSSSSGAAAAASSASSSAASAGATSSSRSSSSGASSSFLTALSDDGASAAAKPAPAAVDASSSSSPAKKKVLVMEVSDDDASTAAAAAASSAPRDSAAVPAPVPAPAPSAGAAAGGDSDSGAGSGAAGSGAPAAASQRREMLELSDKGTVGGAGLRSSLLVTTDARAAATAATVAAAGAGTAAMGGVGVGASGAGLADPAAASEASWESVATVVSGHLYGPAAVAAGAGPAAAKPMAVASGKQPGRAAARSGAGTASSSSSSSSSSSHVGPSGFPLPPPASVRALANLYTDDGFVEELLGAIGGPDAAPPACGVCSGPAPKRCGRCGTAWYCSREHQAEDWKNHKPMCDAVAAATAANAAGTGTAAASTAAAK